MDRSSFFTDVYEVVKSIPSGRVTSYGAIANYLGAKNNARVVGWAMNGCPEDVPAHRVVNSKGQLTGKVHFKEPDKMYKMLLSEGVEVLNDKVTDFKKVFWDPSKELAL